MSGSTSKRDLSGNLATEKESAMARAFQFDVEAVVKQLNRILQMELTAVITTRITRS